MASHGRADRMKPRFDAAVRAFLQFMREIADEGLHIAMPKKGRRLPRDHGAWAEALQHEAALGELVAMLQDKLGVLLGHLHDLGNEQKLPRDAASRKRRFQLLIDDALVSGVLIHEDDAIGGFRNDVGLVQLRPRRAEPLIRLCFGRSIGRGEGRGRFFREAVGRRRHYKAANPCEGARGIAARRLAPRGRGRRRR